ncbi:MAG TPA: response regulator [Chloroflexaceae bacterium]|nr:response regulator [Chloroflexaceae bacterium]
MQEQLLVIEDNVVLQLSLTALLRREGFGILAARSVAEARVQLLRERPSVILLDVGFPDGSGLELLEELRASPDSPLAIVATAGDASPAAVEALRHGAFDVLAKPINNDLLRAAVRRAVEHYRLRQAAREIERLRDHEEAMRAMARAAAHHIGQHLTVIMGETQLLQEEQGDPEVRASLARILRATEQAAQTLVELRAARQFVVAPPAPAGERHAARRRP